MSVTLNMVVGLTGGAILAQISRAWWRRKREAAEAAPVTMKLKKGVWVPDGPLERFNRIDRWLTRISVGWFGTIFFLLVLAAIKNTFWSPEERPPVIIAVPLNPDKAP